MLVTASHPARVSLNRGKAATPRNVGFIAEPVCDGLSENAQRNIADGGRTDAVSRSAGRCKDLGRPARQVADEVCIASVESKRAAYVRDGSLD
jgi:hypothetical protein